MDEIPGFWSAMLVFLGCIVLVVLVVTAVTTGLFNFVLSKTRSPTSAPKRLRFADVMLPTCVLVVVFFMFMQWRRDQKEELWHQETIRQVRVETQEREESNEQIKNIGTNAPNSDL